MVKNDRIMLKVSKTQKLQLIQYTKLFGYDSVAEYIRDSALTKNFMILQRLEMIAKFMEGLKSEKGSKTT